MSFDIFLQTCHLSDQTVEDVNPITGKRVHKVVGETVTETERETLKKLIASKGADAPDEFGCYVITFADGSATELYFEGLSDDAEFSGGVVTLHEPSEELTQFLYSLAEGGNLGILTETEAGKIVVTSNENAQLVEPRFPGAIVISSPEALHLILGRGFDHWIAYRDRVFDDS
ncbi:MAG: hypothetical protein ABIK07_22310 [Planctomycetota bacterium]